jgi:hypothetical protein
MVTVPYSTIQSMLQRLAQLPSVQGDNNASVQKNQLDVYIRALNSIGFYHWSMKWRLGEPRDIVRPVSSAPAPDVIVPAPRSATDALSFEDICVLYQHIGRLKGQKFTWRTLEKRSASEIGRLAKVIYPITHGSFPDGKMAVEALASWMQHSGIEVSDIGLLDVVKPNPAVFGIGGFPFPAEDVEDLVHGFDQMAIPVIRNPLFSLQSPEVFSPVRPPVQLSPAATPSAKIIQDRVRKVRGANGQFASSKVLGFPSV